jgi:hypothetical protein
MEKEFSLGRMTQSLVHMYRERQLGSRSMSSIGRWKECMPTNCRCCFEQKQLMVIPQQSKKECTSRSRMEMARSQRCKFRHKCRMCREQWWGVRSSLSILLRLVRNSCTILLRVRNNSSQHLVMGSSPEHMCWLTNHSSRGESQFPRSSQSKPQVWAHMVSMTEWTLHRRSKRCMERAQRPISRTGMRVRSSRGSLRATSSIQSTALKWAHMVHMTELSHCNSSSSEQVKGWTLKCSFHSIRHNSKVKQLVLRTVQSRFDSKWMQLVVMNFLVRLKSFLPTLEMMIRNMH